MEAVRGHMMLPVQPAQRQKEGLMTRACGLPEASDSHTYGLPDKCKTLSPEWSLDWFRSFFSFVFVVFFFTCSVFVLCFFLSGKVCCVK